uniref:Uncharacterized protein n=1 Tax=Romanomermis culicivorax TaxID=13658 RepID=A0A915KC07_ROMCU
MNGITAKPKASFTNFIGEITSSRTFRIITGRGRLGLVVIASNYLTQEPAIPRSGISNGLTNRFISSAFSKYGEIPPCMQIILDEMTAAKDNVLKHSWNESHNVMSYSRKQSAL